MTTEPLEQQLLEQRLEEAIKTLKSFIAKSPRLSHAAASAQRQIDNLERPDCGFTTAQKLAAIRETIRGYRGERLVDNVLYHPGDRQRS